MICFAAIAPHPPLLLPEVGSKTDRANVENTLLALKSLRHTFVSAKPDSIIISAPHTDWGFDVPLYFLAEDFAGPIETILTGHESPQVHFERGKKFYKKLEEKKRYALIASGDLSHCLKAEGPYGFKTDGPKFDAELQTYLKEKDLPRFLSLDEACPEAGECGLRSFAFLLGMLEAARKNWKAEILSYEGPFGVGYLVAKLI